MKKKFLVIKENFTRWPTIVGPSEVYLDLPLMQINQTKKMRLPQTTKQKEKKSSKGVPYKGKDNLSNPVIEKSKRKLKKRKASAV